MSIATDLVIRQEQRVDGAAITSLLEACFPSAAEAQLVEALRQAGHLPISLVAERDGQLVGHLAFSPVDIERASAGIPGESGPGLGLAPLAVPTEHRRQGIATRLVEAGLEQARRLGYRWVVVLGEPDYYGRFGFQAASAFGLRDAYGGGDAFQVIALQPGGIPQGSGLVSFGPEFALVG
jgi:putative acetyltransferase